MSGPQQQLAGRLAEVQVRVRADLKYTRQVNRDGISYIVHHPVTFQNHRLSAEDYLILSQMRGSNTLGEVFEKLVKQDLLGADQEEDFYRYVVHLNQLHLLQLPISDGAQLHQRYVEKAKQQRVQTAKSFLFFRVPLFEPMAFLDRTMVFARPMFSKGMLFVWLAAFAFCFSLVIRRWSDFTNPLSSMLATSNLVILWGLLLGLKIIHEFGHAYACRHYGAKVPEMGAFFLMGSPCAYMDASDSWNLPFRRQRLIVAMGGMYFESWFAMLGILVWSMTEPSLVNSIAQYTVVLSTIITVGFNINPLMKYDGYYALADLLGRPMLREDASFEFSRVVKRVLFGLRIESNIDSRLERIWLIVFGLSCSIYRLTIAITIATVLGMFIPVLGSIVLTAYIGSTVIKMVKGGLVYLRTSPEIEDRRTRAWVASGMVLAGTLLATFLIPVPGAMRAPGVVLPEKQMAAYATAPGFLVESGVPNGTAVAEGAILCRLTNQELEASLVDITSSVKDLELQLLGELELQDRASAVTQQQLRQARETLAETQQLVSRLSIVAPAQGVISEADILQTKGRYIEAGEPIAKLGTGGWIVSSLIDEETFSDMHPQLGDEVELMLASGNSSTLHGRIVDVRRSASNRIEQPQMTQLGGGDIPVSEDSEAQRPYVELRIAITVPEHNQLRNGQRAVVRFGVLGSSVATVCLRSVRRLFSQLR